MGKRPKVTKPTMKEIGQYHVDVMRVMTTRQICQHSGIDRTTVFNAIRNGHLITFNDGGVHVVSAANVFDWLRKKYGQVVLQSTINSWYAESAYKRSKQ